MDTDNELRDLLLEPFVQKLPPKGKLAFIYMHICIDFDQIDSYPAEDMATETGLGLSELEGWISYFRAMGSRV